MLALPIYANASISYVGLWLSSVGCFVMHASSYSQCHLCISCVDASIGASTAIVGCCCMLRIVSVCLVDGAVCFIFLFAMPFQAFLIFDRAFVARWRFSTWHFLCFICYASFIWQLSIYDRYCIASFLHCASAALM